MGGRAWARKKKQLLIRVRRMQQCWCYDKHFTKVCKVVNRLVGFFQRSPYMLHVSKILHEFLRLYLPKERLQWSNNIRNSVQFCKLGCIGGFFFIALQCSGATSASPSSAYCAGWPRRRGGRLEKVVGSPKMDHPQSQQFHDRAGL